MDLPPWLQTFLTVLGILAVILPPFGRLLAKSWPDFGARVEALGVDLGVGLGKTPPAGMPRGVSPAAPLSERADNATTVVRAELKKAAKEGGPTVPPGVAMLLALALVSCTDLEPAKTAGNATREVGIVGAELLEQLCTVPYQQATTRAEVDAITARGCPEAATAYEDLRAAHTLLVAVIRASEAGQCVGVSKSAEHCNVAGAYVDLAKAASQWAAAVQRIEGDTP